MKPFRLTEDEVATAAQLAGVPPALAIAVWQTEKRFNNKTRDPVDNMHEGLSMLADSLRSAGNDWEDALRMYYRGSKVPMDVMAQAGRMKEQNDPSMQPMGETPEPMTPPDQPMDIPGYTRSMNRPMPMQYEDAQANQAGAANYDFDRYIRKLIDEEFSNA